MHITFRVNLLFLRNDTSLSALEYFSRIFIYSLFLHLCCYSTFCVPPLSFAIYNCDNLFCSVVDKKIVVKLEAEKVENITVWKIFYHIIKRSTYERRLLGVNNKLFKNNNKIY